MQKTDRYTKIIGPLIGIILLYLIISGGIEQFNADLEALREADTAAVGVDTGGEEGADHAASEDAATEDADAEGEESHSN